MNTVITADACVNHNGSVDTLLELMSMIIKVKVVTGENVLFKLQKRDPEKYSDRLYESWLLKKEVPYKVHKKALEFSLEQYIEIDDIARQYQVEWYVSVFDQVSFDLMANNFRFKYWKIASPVTADDPELAEEIAKMPGIKFVSTGMCDERELDITVNRILKVARSEDIYLLHCVSMYPTPLEKLNLIGMDWLKDKYKLKVGLSSHDTGVAISVAAVARGAEAIEKHITLDRGMPGPDHGLSLEFVGLETLVRHSKAVEIAIGNTYGKVYYEEERQVREKVKITK